MAVRKARTPPELTRGGAPGTPYGRHGGHERKGAPASVTHSRARCSYSRLQLFAKAHGPFARRSIAVSRRAAFLWRKMKAHIHGLPTGAAFGLEDAAENLGVGEHVEIFVIPFAGWARG